MIILWIRKNKSSKLEKETKEEKESFLTHDEKMRKFRLDHPDIGVITDNDILTGDGNLLAPVHKVKLTDHAQN
jgi:hypothetical protein